MDLHAIINGCDEKSQLLGPESLTPAESIVVLVSGFACYVTLSMQDMDADWGDELTDKTVAALQAVGAATIAGILARCIGMEGDANRDQRSTAWRTVLTAYAEETPDVLSRLNAFIESHIEELCKT